MISLAPLPSWRALISSLIGPQRVPKTLENFWVSDQNDRVGWMSRSAWSLVLLVRWRALISSSEPVVFWIPDYFCEESIILLRKMNVKIHFYPINENLEPNFKLLLQEAKLTKPDIMLLVHYFGTVSPTTEAREFCKRMGSWLVEDATHVLIHAKGIGKNADFVIYSPHKLLAIPDGALLIARQKGPNNLSRDFIDRLGPPDKWPDQVSEIFPDITQKRYLSFWILKRSLQKLGINRALRKPVFDDTEYKMIFPPPAMSVFAVGMLLRQIGHLEQFAFVRKRNRALVDYLIGIDRRTKGFSITSEPGGGDTIPYLARYRVVDARLSFRHLLKAGVPLTTWPNLPPEVKAQRENHPVATKLRESYLFLPVHQSVNETYLVRSLFKDVKDVKKDVCVKIREFKDDRTVWCRLTEKAEFSNFLQSWSYGECKSHASGWQVVRFLLTKESRIVGFAQVLQRKFMGILSVSRLNRGPLFLKDVDTETRLAGLAAVEMKLANWRRGRVLSWIPECDLKGNHFFHLLRNGFHPLQTKGWSSSVLDLRLEESQLRAGFRASWRHTLDRFKQHESKILQSEDENTFQDLLERYANMLRARSIKVPIIFFRDLYRLQKTEGLNSLFLVLHHDNELAAGIYVAIHGHTATYLLGWSGDLGRESGAHHLLLWDAIVRLKKMKVRYFDLGGIDEQSTPSVAAFKRGLGGRRYQLLGEGWCF
jgi:hypothetical protein